MKLFYRIFIKLILFFVFFCLFFSYTSYVFVPKGKNHDSRVDHFYKQHKNTVDVLFIGSSSFLRGISPITMWDSYGFTSYNRSTPTQNPIVTYYYLVESLKYQHPKVVVIDPIWLDKILDVDKNEPRLRIAADRMRFSKEKILLTLDVIKISDKQDIISYLFPLTYYHSRWNELTIDDFKLNKSADYTIYKGLLPSFIVKDFEVPNDYMEMSLTTATVSSDSLDYYNKIIKLCNENDIPVVLLTLPRYGTWNYAKHLTATNYANENNLIYIDYSLPNLYEEVKFDVKKDFLDANHLNTFGAQKVSEHLGGFLQETYHLPDKRNDPLYKQWNFDYEYFIKIVNKKESDLASKALETSPN